MADYTKDGLTQLGAAWAERIRQADEREKAWVEVAERAEAAFTAGNDTTMPPDWNVVASNTETIVPAIYNSTPVPDIRSRHNVKDPAAEEAADILERAISTAIDDGALDREMEALAQDAFLAGRGVLRVRMEADITPLVYTDPETGEEIDAGEQVTGERLVYENVAWRDYREGPAKRWADVPWIAYRHFLSQDDLDNIEDRDLARVRDDREPTAEREEVDEPVWEIWDRDRRQVLFLADRKSRILKIEDDPLGLKGFFPQPEPVQPIMATGGRIPVCPYALYEKQAMELNRISRRINGILSGIKVKGAIVGGAESVLAFSEAEENTLTPMADLEGLMAVGGLDRAISWWPVDKSIIVLRELYAARDQIKASIYEITGISDIIRGQGAASETATAQQIKTEWGSLRVKKLQRMIERQVRGAFILSAEIMAAHFPPESLSRMAGIPIRDPQVAQLLSRPLDHYRIDVESNSTARADTSMRREEMARFLEGTGAFFATMAPLVGQGPQAAAPIAKIFGAFTTQFSLGKQAEDAVDQLVQLAEQMSQQPPPGQDDGAAQVAQAEMQMKMQEMQARTQEIQMKAQAEMQKSQMEMQVMRAEAALGQEKMAHEREKMDHERQKWAFEERKLQLQIQAQQDRSAA